MALQRLSLTASRFDLCRTPQLRSKQRPLALGSDRVHRGQTAHPNSAPDGGGMTPPGACKAR